MVGHLRPPVEISVEEGGEAEVDQGGSVGFQERQLCIIEERKARALKSLAENKRQRNGNAFQTVRSKLLSYPNQLRTLYTYIYINFSTAILLSVGRSVGKKSAVEKPLYMPL